MFYSQIVDNQRVQAFIANACAPNLEELAISGSIGPNSDELGKKIASIIHNKIMFEILDPIANPAKTEIAKKIAEDGYDPATLKFLVDRLGPEINTVIRNAFNDAIAEIESFS